MRMDECQHEHHRWVRKGIASHICAQCVECKANVTQVIYKTPSMWAPKDFDGVPPRDELPEWDDSPPEPANEERQMLIGLEPHSGTFQNARSYRTYLGSAEWRELRDKVIRRAGGVCEGCLEAKAVEVHHRHYRNIYAEFAFDLVALCRSCHDRAHAFQPELEVER